MIRALVVQLLLVPLRFYKWAISPFLPPMCRFHPSCSVYAMGAIAVHGPFKGTWLAARRLTRCHPFNPGGLDPVPPKDGKRAEEVLAASEPEIVARLKALPHPSLGAVLAPADGHSASASLRRRSTGSPSPASPAGSAPFHHPDPLPASQGEGEQK